MAEAGKGYVDANAAACTSGYTRVDLAYPADERFSVETIKLNIWRGLEYCDFGCGTITGSTFYPRTYVHLISDTTPGYKTFIDGVDFTAFTMEAGDYLFFWADWQHHVSGITTTSSATPEGLGSCSGDGMDLASFTFTTDSSRTPEIYASGTAAPTGWDGKWNRIVSVGKWNGLSDIESINGV